MLLGRAPALAEIDGALRLASEGHGQLLFFIGEAGIGKTRLADEAGALGRARGFTVSWGRTWEGAGAPAGWPFTQILRDLLEDGTVKLAQADRFALAPLLPEFGADESPAPDPSGFRMFEALARVLKRAARLGPRMIVLDDLHAADRSTLSALHFVTRALRGLSIVVVGTHRDADARARPEVHDVLGRIAREGTQLVLSRLDEADAGRLLAERVGDARATRTTAAVFRASEGNPLFVQELARLIERDPNRDLDAVTAALPDGIRTAIAGHVALLTPGTRTVLGAASLLGREFSRVPLEALLDAEASAVDAALSEAKDAGVLRPTSAGASFTHVLLAEALTAALEPGERKRLHPRLRERVATAGASDYLTKPIDLPRLVQVIRGLSA